MSATLGGLIKDYRLQKNLSQMEVVFSLGWKEPSRLSRIEQGRVGNPERKMMDRIIVALKLSEEEKNDKEENPLVIYEKETIIHPDNVKKRLNFYFFFLPLLGNLRFVIEYYMPADMKTFEYFKKMNLGNPEI